MRHNERCDNCKNAIAQMLTKLYNCPCHWEHCFELNTDPEDYTDAQTRRDLKRIYRALQRHGGNIQFIRSKRIRRCDLYIPKGNFIVELDESQHFTSARRVALKAYPSDIKFGFSIERWIELCKVVDAHDNDPPYRDEQRAWYDTLRDFLPCIHNLKPTIRVCLKDFNWCELNPRSIKDRKTFIDLLKLDRRSLK